MAIWGRILINENTIGEWTARRLTRLTTPVDVHDYEWEVEVLPVSLSDAQKARGELTHRYSAGPGVRAAQIMPAAADVGVGVQ